MKKIILLTSLILCSILIKAQDVGDNVEVILNNGYTIKGTIIEKSIEKLKIKNLNDEVLEYIVSDVKEIVKIKEKKKHPFNCSFTIGGGIPFFSIKTVDYRGVYNFENIGNATITNPGISSNFNFLFNAQITKNFSIVTGISQYNLLKSLNVPNFSLNDISMYLVYVPIDLDYKFQIYKNITCGIFGGFSECVFIKSEARALDENKNNINYGFHFDYRINKIAFSMRYNSLYKLNNNESYYTNGGWGIQNFYQYAYKTSLMDLSFGITYFFEFSKTKKQKI